MKTASDKERFEQLVASAREKAAKQKEAGGSKMEEVPLPPKPRHPKSHTTGD
ncbi:hypothetical protein [Pontibacter litorisediminis]|uniref:hypothetical protein n=1 Tax=Pontibacter litorisediminis TaxID=1846260 RepID=UPI0023EB1C58|nr:hypothetical protein [Pontibacter litorisediminis]